LAVIKADESKGSLGIDHGQSNLSPVLFTADNQAQTGLGVFTGEQIFSFITRVVSTDSHAGR
jgi:hypothetical protein